MFSTVIVNPQRRTFLLVLCMLLAVSLYAKPRTIQEAQQIARSFVGNGDNFKKGVDGSVSLAYTGGESTQPLYYVFNKGAGFVIVSADDRAIEVLGYSDSGSFDIDRLPDNFRYWLGFCAAELEMLAAVPETIAVPERRAEASTSSERKSVAPLLGSILWDQVDPYNALCPSLRDGTKTVVGCAATAMAQIMGYYRWPERGSGTIPGYTTSSNGLEIGAEYIGDTYYDWAHMTPVYTAESTPEEKNAVATLMYHCGISLQMDYGTESSAFLADVPHAMITYFDYNENMKIINRLYYSKAEWDSIIRHELDEKRPVYYSGFSEAGGHAFVCDGYDTNGLFHINWGWSGLSNGYFALSDLTPSVQGTGGSTGGFNLGQTIIIGMQPQTMPDNGQYQLCIDTGLAVSRTEIGRYETFEVSVNGLWNNDGKTFEGNIGPALCDGSGAVVCALSLKPTLLEPNYGWNSIAFGENTIPGTVPDGSYRLYLVYQSTGMSDYHIMRSPTGTPNYLDVTVSGGRVIFDDATGFDVSLQLDALEAVGNLYQNREGRFTYTVTNRGCEYVSALVLLLESVTDESVVLWGNLNPVAIASGETQTFEVTENIAVAPGEYNLYLCYDKENSYDDIVYVSSLGESLRVTVRETPVAGVPDLQLLAPLSLGDGGVVNHADIRATVSVTNKGAYFSDDVVAFIFPSTGGSSVGYFGYQKFSIDAGETRELAISDAVGLAEGSYQMVLYYWYDGNWVQFSPVEYSEQFFTLGIPTGVGAPSSTDLAVYPNPAREVLYVRSAGEVLDLSVYDLSGRELLRLCPESSEVVAVPVGDLQAGTYMLRVRSAQEVETVQFIKK